MARVTTITIALFFVATVISAGLLLTGRTAAVEEESASYLPVPQAAAGHAPAPATARRHAE